MSTLLLAGCGVLLVLLRVARYFRAPSALGFNVVLHPLCGDWPSLRSSGPTMSLSSCPALLAADTVSSLYRFGPVRPPLTSARLPTSHSAVSASPFQNVRDLVWTILGCLRFGLNHPKMFEIWSRPSQNVRDLVQTILVWLRPFINIPGHVRDLSQTISLVPDHPICPKPFLL